MNTIARGESNRRSNLARRNWRRILVAGFLAVDLGRISKIGRRRLIIVRGNAAITQRALRNAPDVESWTVRYSKIKSCRMADFPKEWRLPDIADIGTRC